MGSSTKRKKEKQRDFQKPKLKVGKSKPKSANFTNTSFRAKAIVVTQQSLHTSAPSTSYLFTHHLSLLKHHSATTRRESLSYLKAHLPTALASATSRSTSTPNAGASAIPTTAAIVTTLVPLILDPSQQVRAQLLALLEILPEAQLAMYVPKMLLFVNSAMTHISEEIRADSTRFLEWLVELGRENVFGGGGWGVCLRGIAGCLGWGGIGGSGGRAIVPKVGDGKVVIQHLAVLKRVLEAGLLEKDGHTVGKGRAATKAMLHSSSELHSVPNKTNVYAFLNLFSVLGSGGSSGQTGDVGLLGDPEDRDSRVRYLVHGPGKEISTALELGLTRLKKDGGEVGRASGRTLAVLDGVLKHEVLE